MKQFKTFSSHVVSLPLKDIDTDMIIPAEYLKSTSKTGYGEHLFHRLRQEDSSFCLHDPRSKSASILVAGINFGCGSSREHAVWALQGWGFQTIIAPSFADIFSGNSAKNGLLLVTLPEAAIDEITQSIDAEYHLTINLEAQMVTSSHGERYQFHIDPFIRERFLLGLDEFDYLLTKRETLKNFFASSTIHRFQSKTYGEVS